LSFALRYSSFPSNPILDNNAVIAHNGGMTMMKDEERTKNDE